MDTGSSQLRRGTRNSTLFNPQINYMPVSKTKTKSKRLCLYMQDEKGDTYGIISLAETDFLDVSYNAIQHQVAITLKSSFTRGNTAVEPIQNAKVENKKIVPLPGYTFREMYKMEGYHHIITITNEEEMQKVWEFVGEDWKLPLKLRKNIVDGLEAAKLEAIKRAEDAEKDGKTHNGLTEDEALNGGSDGEARIIGLRGEKLSSETIDQ